MACHNSPEDERSRQLVKSIRLTRVPSPDSTGEPEIAALEVAGAQSGALVPATAGPYKTDGPIANGKGQRVGRTDAEFLRDSISKPSAAVRRGGEFISLFTTDSLSFIGSTKQLRQNKEDKT